MLKLKEYFEGAREGGLMAWACVSKSAKTTFARRREERVPPHAISLARAEPRFDAQKVDNLDLVHVSLRSPGNDQDEKKVKRGMNASHC